jgi:hypothetical protein
LGECERERQTIGTERKEVRGMRGERGAGFQYLGGADGGKVLGMREEDAVGIAEVLVELDWSLGCLGLKVRGNAAQPQLRLFNAVDCAAHILCLCGR